MRGLLMVASYVLLAIAVLLVLVLPAAPPRLSSRIGTATIGAFLAACALKSVAS